MTTERLKGKIVLLDNKFYVHIEKKASTTGSLFEVVNKTLDMLREGSEVECELVCVNRTEKRYKAHVHKELSSPMDYDAFIRLVNYAVTNRMSMENMLFGAIVDPVTADDLQVNTRRREVVICRNMAIHFVNEYLGRQLDFSDIGLRYKRSRSMVYVSLKEIDNYLVDKQLYNIFTDIKKEVELIYNNLKED